jgi:phosphoribosylformimino-5-aminoimidazole carboxamide ribotide isomerase
VIVTSYVFKDGKISWKNLNRMKDTVGKENLVLDLSCRKKDGKYYIVTDRWQTFTNVELGTEILGRLSGYCDEFLVHGVDVEGKASGIEQELIEILKQADIPVTYAGGIGSMEDMEQIRRTGNGKVDFTIGSALDLFGGRIPYEVIKEYH